MSLERAPDESRAYRLATLMSLVATPILIIACGVLLFATLRGVDQTQRSVADSYQTREQILRVFSLLQDAETGQRGFVITGRETFLEPYNEARAELQLQFMVLGRLFAEEADQRGRMVRLQGLSDAKLRHMEQSVALRRDAGAAAAAGLVSSERGKEVMDAIRVTVDEMAAAESASLDRRLAQSGEATRRVELVAGFLVLLLIGSLVTSVLLVRRYNQSRRRLLHRMRQHITRQEAIFDGTLDGMITLNPSGSIENVNTAVEETFGWKREELSRRDISVLMDIAPGEGLFLERFRETGAREITGKRKDGTTFDAEIAIGSMTLDDGEHLIAAIRDVTSRKEGERLKEEFISTVSHELRTPLTSIAGALGLIESGAAGKMPEKAERLVFIAKTSSERLVRLINDLLDVEKIASGQVRFDLQPVDLRGVARRAVEEVAALAAERRIEMRLETPNEALMVRGDIDRLVQVFTNLLSNAVKFSPDDGVVDFVLAARDGRVRVLVRDQGPGVPQHFRDRIFSKFAQADSSTARVQGGTGLGLAITKEIVERHHGRVRLISPPSEGAVFEVELPRLAGIARDEQNLPRLLLCEDDPYAAEVLSQCLEREGFAVDRAATIGEAEEALRTRKYASLLLDLNLPDGDGLSLIQRLRSDPEHSDLPVVVITGEMRGRETVAGGLTIADWIQKPVDPLRLRQSIRAALPARNDLCILHVDDDRDLTEVVATALAEAGEVCTAATQAEARELITSKRFDLVVLDIGLPDGSGLDLLPDIGTMEPRPSVIVYSGQEIEPELLGRVDAVLTKSRTSFETLVETVRKLTLSEET